MRLLVRQTFTRIAPDAVAAAYADPTLYEKLAGLRFGGDPEVLEHSVADGAVSLAIRYRIQADLPSAAQMFVDPDKLTFVEYTTLDPYGCGTFDIIPDHYDTMLQAWGEVVIGDSPTHRLLKGELSIDLGWTGILLEGTAERQIAEGLERVLLAQVDPVEEFVLARLKR